MISVCIATYNGEKYIREQLDSILAQLGPDDEVIVCDDRSSDRTLELIEDYRDSRIHVHRNEKNLGHVRNFEKAISLSRGDYIFLSDQDDVWLPGRVQEMLGHMQRDASVALVASNFDLINDEGVEVGEYRLLGPVKRSRLRQVLAIFAGKSPYFGCTFLLKRNVLTYCLPIPKDIESHDIWIALMASVFGRVVNISGATLKHRIHDRNMTTKSRRALSLVLKSRYHFFRSLALRVFCFKFKIH
ncbi:glycosyltransferase family 2 protein [Paraburkholderia azotifigens]|uniref:Glycosyltransferase family 2 protein n=1 Tax=Paraburkholderia azotifigens TaxID=2057004 RepID=A0A5C6VU25_9BURK|nr:glycosyltransferase family 2 protein [Paraburkholderia azotifigens]TXC88843.1 glycosyltransferase family 2 protein [Paraburkholderia azotifigens]